MIAAAGRFLFDMDMRAAEDGVDASRDWAGVHSSEMLGPIEGSFFTVMPGSVISMRSSSSDAGVPSPSWIGPVSSGADQTPSGSTTTCSASVEVDRRMSSTYL